jgi:3-oxoacyl-[acyl-carrier-protein] synthase III
LAAAAVGAALDDAQLQVYNLDYLIGHTTSPAYLLPKHFSGRKRLKFTGPYIELRQACTGFANALVVAQSIASVPRLVWAVAIVGSETGSVFFDPNAPPKTQAS